MRSTWGNKAPLHLRISPLVRRFSLRTLTTLPTLFHPPGLEPLTISCAFTVYTLLLLLLLFVFPGKIVDAQQIFIEWMNVYSLKTQLKINLKKNLVLFSSCYFLFSVQSEILLTLLFNMHLNVS